MGDPKTKKSIVIIKTSAESLKGSEQFLKNRDWIVYSTKSLKEALIYIVQNKPSFVMLNVDHPNKKVRQLPRILLSSFPVCVIVYAERASAQSFRLLMESRIEYKVNPPVTGPAIERTINKYLRDLEKKELGLTENPEDQNDGKDLVFEKTKIVKGEKKSDVLTFKNDAKQSKFEVDHFSRLVKKMGEEDGSSPSDEDSSKDSDVIVSGQRKKAGNNWYDSLDEEEESASDSTFESEDGFDPFLGTQGGPGKGKGFSTTQEGAAESDEHSAIQEGNESDEHSATEEGLRSKLHHVKSRATNFGDDEDAEGDGNPLGKLLKTGLGSSSTNTDVGENDPLGSGHGEFENSKNNSSLINNKGLKGSGNPFDGSMDSNDPNGENGSLDPQSKPGFRGPVTEEERNSNIRTIMNKKANINMESLIVRGTQKALDETVNVKDGRVHQHLEDSTNVACIIIESSRFSGYLITAMGKNRKIDNTFLKTIQSRLLKFLKDNGEDIGNEENLQLKIKKVDFEDWAIEKAEFLRKSVHNGDQVAMAFFPYAQPKAKVGESAQEEMASVSIEDLQPDKEVDFNVYIYLPTNKKYVLYTPKGSVFYGKQKEKLMNQGVGKLHMLKSEVQDLTKYKAQNHLNTLITDHEEKKKKKAS